jgi:ribosome-binding factor A
MPGARGSVLSQEVVLRGRRREPNPHPTYPRVARVNELLREVLAEQLERLADTDERLSLITITGIETTSDLGHARVYLSSLEESVGEVLEEHRAHLQRSVASQVRMKRTPLLEFASDPAVAHGMRVEEILRRMHETDQRTGEFDNGGAQRAARRGSEAKWTGRADGEVT